MFNQVQDLASGVPELFRHAIALHKNEHKGELPVLLVAHPSVVASLKMDAPESVYPDFTGIGIEFDAVPVMEWGECEFMEMLTCDGEREWL